MIRAGPQGRSEGRPIPCPHFPPDTGPHRRGADLSQMGPVRLQHRAHRGRCCGGVSLRNRLGGSVPGAPALGHSFPSPGRRGHRPALPLERDGAGPGHQSGADGGPGGRAHPSAHRPLIFLSTILTHLVGGSAGREGPPSSWGAPSGPGWAERSTWMRRTAGSWSCAACPPPSPGCSAPPSPPPSSPWRW